MMATNEKTTTDKRDSVIRIRDVKISFGDLHVLRGLILISIRAKT